MENVGRHGDGRKSSQRKKGIFEWLRPERAICVDVCPGKRIPILK